MVTSYLSIFKKFNDNFNEDELKKVDISHKYKYLRNAISLYIATISLLTNNTDEELIEEDLTEVETMLLGLLMYDSYLDQEILKYNKIINISNEFVKMTGAIDRVKTLKDMKELNQTKINNILSGML